MTATAAATQEAHATTPRLTIVIEWENVLLAEAERALRMLTTLGRQVADLGWPAEALVLFDDGEVDRAMVERAVAASRLDRHQAVSVELIAVRGLHYYDLKNAGASRARGDIVVFLDSDVVPEQGWLANLLEPFSRPDVEVVGSNPYIEATSLYSKMFALTWFFPLRTEHGPVRPARQFYANSVAFRRATLAAHPFPTGDGRARGACTTLSMMLRDEGITVWCNPRAKVAHPPPNGLRHFLVRALYDGHDRAVEVRRRHDAPALVLARGVAQNALETGRGLFRILRYRTHVGLDGTGVPAVLALSMTYAAVRMAGYLVATVRPDAIPDRFSI
ncbi:MAG TPA: glycosyltransferase [Egibacteraceae bacterium]|nr:glycosyltransferase [Egibacteraceae bacterium]